MDKHKGKSNTNKELERLQKRKNKLNSLKNEFEGEKIKEFAQIFAILDPSPLAKELAIPFYTFKKKVADPGEFTNNELIRLAELINVEYELVYRFIYGQIKALSKKIQKGNK